MKYLIILLATAALTLTSCKEESGSDVHAHDDNHGDHGHANDNDDDGHAGHEHGPNGGELKSIGSIGKLEYKLDESAGTMVLFILDKDAKKSVEITKAPQLVAKINGKRVAVDFESDSTPSSKFIMKHDVLKAHTDLNILLTVDGNDVPFNIPIPHMHH